MIEFPNQFVFLKLFVLLSESQSSIRHAADMELRIFGCFLKLAFRAQKKSPAAKATGLGFPRSILFDL